MLELKNVRKKNNILSADYCYSDDTDLGHVKYDVDKHEFLNIQWNEQDKKSDVHYGFRVKNIFEQMILHNKYPENYIMMWY